MYHDHLLATMRRRGVHVQAELIQLGIVRGVRLRNVTVFDESLNNWPLIQAEEVRIVPNVGSLFKPSAAIDRLEIEEGRLRMPLPGTASADAGEASVLHLHNLRFRLQETEHTYVVRDLQAQVENVVVQAQGRLVKSGVDEPPAGWDALVAWLNNRERLHAMNPAWRERLLDIKSFLRAVNYRAEPSLSVNFRVPLARPEQARVRLGLLLRDFSWRGLGVQHVTSRVRLEPGSWKIEELSVQLTDQEWLHAEGVIDPASWQLQAIAALRMYPRRYFVLADSWLLGSPYFPDFTGAPPYVSLRIAESPLFTPERWDVTAFAEVESARMFDTAIRTARGRVAWNGDRLHVTEFRAVLQDEARIEADYLYHPHEGRMLLRANVTGEPHFVPQFTPDEAFRDFYPKIWESFDWRSAIPPHFEFDLYRYAGDDGSNLFIHGRSEMRDFNYNGQHVDSATGSVYLDLASDQLLITDLHVVQSGQQATGNLLFQFQDDDSHLRFDVDSHLESRVLLNLVHPEWRAAQERLGLTFPEGGHFIARGAIPLDGDMLAESVASGTLFAETASIRGSTAEGLLAHANLTHGNLHATAMVNRLVRDHDALNQVEATIESDFSMVSLVATARSLDNSRLSATSPGCALVWEDGSWSGGLRAEAAAWRDHNGKPLLDIGNVEVNELAITAEGVTADIIAIDLSSPFASMSSYQGNVMLQDERPRLSGTVHDLRIPVISGVAAEAKLTGHIDDDGAMHLWLETDTMKGRDEVTLQKLWVHLIDKEERITSVCRVESLSVPDVVKAEEVLGTLQIIGDTVHFETTAGRVVTSHVDCGGVEAWGTRTAGDLVADVSANEVRLSQDYVLTDLRGPLTYRNDELALHNITANAYGGRITGQFHLAPQERGGTLQLVINGMKLEHLPTADDTNDERKDRPNEMHGAIDAQIGTRFSYEGEQGLVIHGNGEMTIGDGAIWRFPILSEFLDLLNRVNLLAKLRLVPDEEFGRITQLKSTFEFQGNRIYVDSMRTNGSILALSGEGYYWWKTQGVDFRLQAHLLRNLLPVPLFKPFMAFFERRRLGTLKDGRWEELTALRDVFRSETPPVDPTIEAEAERKSKETDSDETPLPPALNEDVP